MTEEEVKRLVEGDVVLVRAEVVGVEKRGGWGTSTVRVQADDAQCYFVAPDIHSVLPRPLAVGDRVTVNGATGELVAVRGDYGWAILRHDNVGLSDAGSLWKLSDLERAP